MDIREIKIMAIKLRRALIDSGITPDIILLFGSFAKKKTHKDSDIDLAVVSRQYGFDRFEEGWRLNFIASSIDPRIEAIPVGLDDYLKRETLSPILHEIKKTGTCLM
jgi:predicted nucleotidyltransferase